MTLSHFQGRFYGASSRRLLRASGSSHPFSATIKIVRCDTFSWSETSVYQDNIVKSFDAIITAHENAVRTAFTSGVNLIIPSPHLGFIAAVRAVVTT